MDWKEWQDKTIFVKLKSGGVYSGKVVDIEDTGNGLIFIEILDKFNSKVVFTTGEIIKIVEETP